MNCVQRNFTIGALAFIWVLLPFLLSADPVKRSRLLLVPKSTMNSMGSDAFKEIKKKTPQEKDPAVNQHVQCIVDRLLRHTKDKTGVKKWETVVFQDKAINAFALPGGKIGVYTGLMQVAENADQLAAVIGHEIGHVIAQHGNERMSEGVLVQGGFALLGGALGDKDSSRNKTIMGALGLGVQFGVLLPHSRTHESESDLIGLDLMAKAGFDPRESVQLWKNMGKAGGNQPPEFASTHPSHKTRIDDLKDEMKKPLRRYEKLVQAGQAHNCGASPFHPQSALQKPAIAPSQAPLSALAPVSADTPLSASCQPASGKNFQHCDFANQNLDGADFRKANIAGISFKKASLKKANFAGAQCQGTDFSHSSAKNASFKHAHCKSANFNKANLGNANFQYADLRSAKFRKANIEKADFKKADLRQANIKLANNRSSANLKKAKN
ncbi:MAG: M48 family metalloprotease [SAR324 cluster bacterium]|nr:M48 family metalloprotease [SAR324 cluster bacterium]